MEKTKTAEEILAKHAKNYKKTIDLNEKTLFHLQLNGFEAVHAMEEYADQFKDERQKDVSWLKELIDIRNKLYNQMPASGEIDAWAMVHVVKSHINDIDVLCSRINSLAESGDAVAFAEWIHKENYRRVANVEILWGKGHENENYTTQQLYSLFKERGAK